MKKCILIFDDDLDILMVSKIILENQNYRVETRICCDDIIKDIAEVNPGMILMDLRIPTIGGEQATRLVKDKKATKHIPVIIFSANTEIEQVCERANANGFLKKPFEIKNLLSIVEENI
jgi:two-component system cell cycle response regulator DivK